MSSIKSLYAASYVHAAHHVDQAASKVASSTNLKFFSIHAIQLVTKTFTSLLAFLASLYEFFVYCTTIKLSSLISKI